MKTWATFCASLLLSGCYTGWQGSWGATDGQGDEAGDSEGDGGDDEGDSDSDGEALDCEAGPSAGSADLVRLSTVQYDHTVRDLLGVDLGTADSFVSDTLMGKFRVGAPVAPLVATQLVMEAEALANGADLAALVPCDPAVGDDACADAFIAQFGRRAFRHDLDDQETAALRDIYDAGGDFEGGVRLVIQAALQAPQFLFLYVPDTGDAGPGEVVLLDDASVASRLSYLLWNTMPDDALLDAASAGELTTAAGLDAQLDRMLADPRAEQGVLEFYRSVLRTDLVAAVEKDEHVYPGFSDQLAADLQASIEQGLRTLHLSEEPGTLSDLLSGLPLYATSTMADYYGWQREAGAGLTPVTDRGEHAGGLLSHPAMSTLLAESDKAAIVHRGAFARDRLLCSPLPPPPDGVEADVDQYEGEGTPREIVEAIHQDDPYCASCHDFIDPIGFAMENYDADGRWRSHYAGGEPVDASATLVLEPGDTRPFEDLAQLEGILAEEAMMEDCMIDHWLTFAARRLPDALDECTKQDLRAELQQSGGRLDRLVRATVHSDAFRYVSIRE